MLYPGIPKPKPYHKTIIQWLTDIYITVFAVKSFVFVINTALK